MINFLFVPLGFLYLVTFLVGSTLVNLPAKIGSTFLLSFFLLSSLFKFGLEETIFLVSLVSFVFFVSLVIFGSFVFLVTFVFWGLWKFGFRIFTARSIFSNA